MRKKIKNLISKKLNYLILILLILASLVWTAVFQKSTDQNFHAFMLDVGQGMAIYLRFPNGQDLLYDGGPDDKVLQELGEVMPAWDRKIDYLISSHNHSDHLVGLIAVLEKFTVDEVWLSGAIHTTDTYQRFLAAIDENGARTKIAWADVETTGSVVSDEELRRATGASLRFGEAKISVLYPLTDLTGSRPENQNNASVAIRIDYGQTSILLPGEVEKEAEVEMVNFYCLNQNPCDQLHADILQSPHQGSHSSSTPDFLQAVNPSIALIAVGADNKYGHPHQDVLNRYKQMSIDYFRTDQCGRIEVIADLNNYQINSKCHD